MLSVRVFFEKKDGARFISHLDLNRAVSRILVRTGLPVVYSQGFNPHIKVVFALPLSIYQESQYEIFDFKLTEDVPKETVADALRTAMPESLQFITCEEPIMKLGDVAKAEYKIKVYTKAKKEDVEKLFDGDVVVLRKTKTKEFEDKINDRIFSLSVSDDTNISLNLNCVLRASNSEYLNPQYIVNHIAEHFDVYDSEIKRTKLFTENGELFR